MGLVVKTDGKPVTVYRQDKTANSGTTYQQYSLGVSSKDKDGNWVNGFIDCQFKKGVAQNGLKGESGLLSYFGIENGYRRFQQQGYLGHKNLLKFL